MKRRIMRKKVVITGVSGQVGSWMVDYLLKNTDVDIVGTIRRLSVNNHENISHNIDNARFRLELMDIGDSTSIRSLIKKEKPDYFINCAANSFVGDSWKVPEQHIIFNGIGVLHQLEAIKDHCLSCRYLNMGSSEEFGNVLYSPQDINHPPRSRSPYGCSKVYAHQIVKVYRDSYNLYAVQPNCFNNESERRGFQFLTRKVTQGVARIKKSLDRKDEFKPIFVGNVTARRDWSHSLDFCDGLWKILCQDEPKEYILSSNETHSVKEFVKLAFEFAGIDGEWVGKGLSEAFVYVDTNSEVNPITLVEISKEFYRPAEVDVLHGDSTPIRQELGWKPKVSFKELVKRMVLHDINLLK